MSTKEPENRTQWEKKCITLHEDDEEKNQRRNICTQKSVYLKLHKGSREEACFIRPIQSDCFNGSDFILKIQFCVRFFPLFISFFWVLIFVILLEREKTSFFLFDLNA